MMRPLLAVCCAASIASAASQEGAPEAPLVILPGDPRIDATDPPHSATWRLIEVSPSGEEKEVGSWTDARRVVERDGRQLMRFQTDVVRTDGAPRRRDIKFWDRSTLQNVSVELENYNRRGGWAYIHYDDRGATTVFRRDTLSTLESTGESLEHPVFEAGQGAMLLQQLGLEVGRAVRYPYHDPTKGELRWMTTTIKSRARIGTSSSLGSVEAYVTENTLSWTYWLIGEPPYVLRLETPGPNGGILVWDLIDFELTP